jgi:hypothetical protein
MVWVWKTHNWRNPSLGDFGRKKWVHRVKSVKIIEAEQR